MPKRDLKTAIRKELVRGLKKVTTKLQKATNSLEKKISKSQASADQQVTVQQQAPAQQQQQQQQQPAQLLEDTDCNFRPISEIKKEIEQRKLLEKQAEEELDTTRLFDTTKSSTSSALMFSSANTVVSEIDRRDDSKDQKDIKSNFANS